MHVVASPLCRVATSWQVVGEGGSLERLWRVSEEALHLVQCPHLTPHSASWEPPHRVEETTNVSYALDGVTRPVRCV